MHRLHHASDSTATNRLRESILTDRQPVAMLGE
jgi:hypothetical protein